MKYVKFYTLGCKVNMYETEAMKALFIERGFNITNDDNADIFVINTCTVTAVGDKKSRQMIRRAKKNNKNAIVVVVGCYSQVAPKKVAELAEVDIILGTYGRKNIVDYVLAYNGDKMICVSKDIPSVYEDIRSYEQSRTRATIKIQDGCRSFCSYCIIPYARGPLRSRPPQDIISEVTELVEKGYKEFVFVGINLAAYYYEGMSLGDIIERICKIDNVERIRLGSLEPNVFSDKFLEVIKNQKKLCRHFHISLQSGCTDTLKRMNRRYTAEQYLAFLDKIKSVDPGVNFTTDIMVGFPGETDEEFLMSCETVKKAGFGSIHVFPYSKREGTPAADMDNQVTDSIKSKRAAEMAQIGHELKQSKLKSFIGKTVEVLFENEIQNGVFEGFTNEYIRLEAKGEELEGCMKKVVVDSVCDDYLTGTVLI